MPASLRSKQLTEQYRDRLSVMRARLVQVLRRSWRIDPEDVDGTFAQWLAMAVPSVTAAQTAGITLTSLYLAGYLSSELGRREAAPGLNDYAGQDPFGRPLERALTPPVMTIKLAIGNAVDRQRAVVMGRERALRIANEATIHAPRQALLEAIDADPRMDGYRRVTTGTCAACASLAGRLLHGIRFEVHANCQCVSAPNVLGVPETIKWPTGMEIFAAKTEEEQDAEYGPERAQLIRSGVPLEDLIVRDELALGGTVITEKPLSKVKPRP